MKDFNNAPEIKVGSVFYRVDRNGKEWTATVINRTEFFVDVEKRQPYQIRVSDGYGKRWYEDAPAITERCAIVPEEEEVPTGEMRPFGLFGGLIPAMKRVCTGEYFIRVKEVYSRFPDRDKWYKLKK